MSKPLSPAMLDHLRRAPFTVTFWGGRVFTASPRPCNAATLFALTKRGLLSETRSRFGSEFELTDAGRRSAKENQQGAVSTDAAAKGGK